MNATLQATTTTTPLSADDLALVLALTRARTLADAGARLNVDTSTVFRALHRVEKRLGRRLFERDRTGYRAGELALQLAAHAERIEGELEAARSQLAVSDANVSGLVRITTTDTLLYGLVMPVLDGLMSRHPNLRFDLDASNELANLTRRDADIALRATQRPPDHLVGRRLGAIRVAVFAHRNLARRAPSLGDLAALPWAVPDEALPDHPSVGWRRKHLPKVVPRLELHSILAVMESVAAGLAVGIVPLFLARAYSDVTALTEPLTECESDLWLLSHSESRHLRRIAVVAAALAEQVRLQ
ncbi:MAG: LysR family transcriptional regulator [Burkholderiales bacterium]